MESGLHLEKVRIDSEVPGVGYMMHFQQAVLAELHSGIHVLYEQHIGIGGEAMDLFVGIHSELEAQIKNLTDNGLQIFTQNVSLQAVETSVGVLFKRIEKVNKGLEAITQSMKHIPSKRELRRHQATMDERLAQVEAINTGLTTVMEHYIFSESIPFEFPHNFARPSGTHQSMHPQTRSAFQSPSVSSVRDTESASSGNFGRIRGGPGSDGAAGAADCGAAGGTEG